jgi:hypothetical protein
MLPLIPIDKANHVVYGAVLFIALMPVAGVAWAAGAVVVAAAAKELRDATGRGTPEWMDFLATIAGGAIPLVAVLLH